MSNFYSVVKALFPSYSIKIFFAGFLKGAIWISRDAFKGQFLAHFISVPMLSKAGTGSTVPV